MMEKGSGKPAPFSFRQAIRSGGPHFCYRGSMSILMESEFGQLQGRRLFATPRR